MRRRKRLKAVGILYVVMNDFFMGVSGLVLTLFVMVAMMVNDTKSPGALEVSTFWNPVVDKDIDTWGKVEGRPWVGFNSPGTGDGLTLVYDDKGLDGHKVPRNSEDMYARELIPGKWTINIHYYANKDRGTIAEDVNVILRIKEKGSSGYRELVDETITLSRVKEEVTVCTFEIDDNGKVIDDSITIRPPTVFRPRTR